MSKAASLDHSQTSRCCYNIFIKFIYHNHAYPELTTVLGIMAGWSAHNNVIYYINGWTLIKCMHSFKTIWYYKISTNENIKRVNGIGGKEKHVQRGYKNEQYSHPSLTRHRSMIASTANHVWASDWTQRGRWRH